MSAEYETKALQDEGEIARFVQILQENHVASYLEIGSKFGGSLWKVAGILPPGSKIVAVDLPGGTKAWRSSSLSLQACIARLREMGHDAHVIFGDSTEPRVVDVVSNHGPFDAVLIDANHTRPYLEKDWATYGPLGKIVAFHDISWRRAPEWVGYPRIEVPQFWADIKSDYRHEEIRLCHTGEDNGIGVLWRSAS